MVRMCLKDLFPCFLRILKLAPAAGANKEQKGDGDLSRAKLASTGSFWKKLKAPIKSYLSDMLLVCFCFLVLIIIYKTTI